jgi:hypothetical protein
MPGCGNLSMGWRTDVTGRIRAAQLYSIAGWTSVP